MGSKSKVQTETLEVKYTELPSGWDYTELGKVVDYKKGYPFNSDDFQNEGVRVIRISDTNANGIKNDGGVYIDAHLSCKLSDWELKSADIIVQTVGSRPPLYDSMVGKTILVNKQFDGALLNQNAVRLRIKNGDNLFLYAHLKTKRYFDFIETLIRGNANQVSITLQDLFKFKIPLPHLPEQRAIANILSTWDTAIQTTQALISQKEQEKKWLMQNLLTGKKRLKGFSGEWKEVKMSYIFERVNRKNSEQNTNVVTISAQRGFVKQTDFFNKTVASDLLDNYFLVEKGEFCYNKSYSNGYPWGATKRLNDFDKAVVTTLYICFKIADSNKNSGEFFEQFFNANSLDKGLTKIAHEGGRAHGLLNVTPSDFFELKITVPDIEEQTAIAQVLQTADKEIELLKAKLQQQKLQKKGLMQVLLTGKLRVASV